MRSLSELGKIDLLVLFVGGAALAIGSLLLLEIALCDLTGLYEPQSNRDRGKSSIPKPRVIEPPFTKLAAFRTFTVSGVVSVKELNPLRVRLSISPTPTPCPPRS